MKTLKKTLCLVLAMVMVFGLCAVSASAKLDAYDDKDDITYAEAVDVMTGIGILAGDARGFRPGDSITRAEAAKIIAYVMIGNAGQADALKAASDPFVDVPASHWAAGYISYCATSGIIAGMGDGYHPNDNVTGLQFAKMLLCALGYGVNDEYVGADWAINVSRDALRLGIFKGNLAGANNNAATREECALYAFNTIAGVSTSGTPSGTTGIAKVSYSALLGGYITKNAIGSGTTDAPDANMGTTFAQDFNLNKDTAKKDPFGRPTGHHWYQNRKSNIISADYDDPDKLKATFTTAVSGDDLWQVLGDAVLDDAKLKLEYYVDTDTATIEATAANDAADNIKAHKDNLTKGETRTLAETGNGVQTHVYQWYDGEDCYVRICVIDTYLVKVQSVKAATASKDPVTTVIVETQDNDPSLSDFTYKTDEFDVDDYVLITKSKGEIQSMEPAITVESAVSSYTNKANTRTMVADGKTYGMAKNGYADGSDWVSADDVDRTVVDGKDKIIYVDEYGYVIGVSGVKAATNYAFVAQWGIKAGAGNSISKKDVLMADVYFDDGHNEAVEVKLDKGVFTDVKKIVTTTPSAADELYVAGNEAAAVTLNSSTVDSGVYAYKMDGGKIVLYNAAGQSGAPTGLTKGANYGANVKVTKGNSNIDSVRADSKTVFFYVNDKKANAATGTSYGSKDYKVTVYTGINNIPVAKELSATPTYDAEAAGYKLTISNGTNDIIKAMVVKSSQDGGEKSAVYFYLGSKDYDGDDLATFTKNGDYSVDFDVYDGSREMVTLHCNGYTEDDVDEGIEALDAPGFVIKGTDGKLYYVEDADFDSVTHTIPKKEGDLTYLDKIAESAVSYVDASTIEVTSGSVQYSLPDDVEIVDLRDTDAKITTRNQLSNWVNGTNGYTAATTYNFAIAFNASASNKQVSVLYIY